MHINAPRDQSGGIPLLLRPCRRESPARAPRGARVDPAAGLGFAGLPTKQLTPRVSHPRPVGPGGGKHRAEKGCGEPLSPRSRGRGAGSRQDTQPPSGRAAAAVALPPVPTRARSPRSPWAAGQGHAESAAFERQGGRRHFNLLRAGPQDRGGG